MTNEKPPRARVRQVYEDDETRQRMQELAAVYGGASKAHREAVNVLYGLHFPRGNRSILEQIEQHTKAIQFLINCEWSRIGDEEEAREYAEEIRGNLSTTKDVVP